MKILSFLLSKGNKDDRDKRIVEDLTKHVFGKLFGDKGYLSSSLFDRLFQNGVHLITKVKKNHLMELKDKILLRKRAIIETVNDELKNICQLEHARHRSINGFLLNIISTLVAYSYFPKKPSLNIHNEKTIKNSFCLSRTQVYIPHSSKKIHTFPCFSAYNTW
jgi:hypothetical protein